MGGLGGCSQASCMISPALRSDYSQFTFSSLDKQKQPVLPPFPASARCFPSCCLSSPSPSLPGSFSPRSGRDGPHLFCPFPQTPGCVICTCLRLTLHGKNESAGKFLFYSHLQFSAVAPSLFCFPSAGSLFYTQFKCLSAYLQYQHKVQTTR